MTVEFGVGRAGGLAGLRIGAALALVLAAGSLAPAIAQSAPDQSAPEPTPIADEDPQAARTAEGQSGEDRDRDRVYVFGRKVSSSIATLPSVEDAPQVINVISGETLAEQGVVSLEQALRNVPGITTQIGEGGVMNGDQFFIRGLAAKDDIYTDGLRDFGVYTRDSFNYGQVEVLKGPSSTTLGRGTTGGGINTTSKTPYLETGGSIALAGGSAEYGRATADWNHVLGAGIAVRLNAMVHQNEVEGRDLIRSERWGLAPSIGFGLDGATSFTLAALYQEDERVPDYGLPTATVNGIGVPVTELGAPSNFFYGFEADTDETQVFTATARLRHEVNDDLVLTSDTKYGSYTRYFQQTPVSCGTTASTAIPVPCSTALIDNDPATIPLISVGGPGPYDQTTDGVQNVSTLSYTGNLGGFRNELLAGWDVSWQHNDRDQFNYASRLATKTLFDPVRLPNPTLAAVKNNIRDTTAKDVSIFISDRFWFTEQWSVSGGVRAQWYEVDQNTTAFNATTCNGVTGTFPTCYTPLSSNSKLVTPRVSVIFEPTMTSSYYVSYATSATPPGITVSNGSTIGAPGTGNSVGTSDLDPEENESLEVGAKFQLFGDRLLVQGAVFQVKKNNAKEIDPLSNAVIRSGDSQEVTGFELGAGGAITDQWSINASYAYTDSETTESATAANIGKRVPFSPEQAASLWTTYNFLGAFAGLEIGAGVTHQGDVALNATNTAFAPEFTSLDALISYGWDRYRLSLNAYNLADELYYSQVHGSRVVPAAGRNFIATLGVVF
jgi:catecholate siderophore receptor